MAGRRRSILALCLLTSCVSPIFSAAGSENVAYRYDERGRLVKVSRSGTVNNGVNACYAYDKADNRTNVTVFTSASCGPEIISFAINDVSVTEGGNLVFTVTKTGVASSSYSVNFATANGTATAGSDYTANSSTLTFAPADVTKTITVLTTDDAALESAETVLVNLSGATGGVTISDAQGVGTINDNDVAPTCGGISFTVASNAAVTEGASSAFTVTKAGTTSNSCSVNYATANGTATSGSDYSAKSGTLTFTSAQTSQAVNVTTIDDSVVESAETFTMSLSSPTGGSTVGTPGSATATINDNDTAAASFSIADASQDEGNTMVLTVTRSGTTSTAVGVSFATANNTAIAGSDYTAASGTLSFAAGQTSKTVSVNILTDSIAESPETFFVNLTNPTGGATISDAQAVGTIVDVPPPEQCFDEGGRPIPCALPPPPDEDSAAASGEKE